MGQTQLDSWLAQDTATGNWDGIRDELDQSGITPALNYTTNVLGNPIGGQSQSTAYSALLYGSLSFDLEKLVGLKGSSFFAAGSWSDGRDLSADVIGNFFTASEIFTGDSVRLSETYFRQSFWQGLATAKIGRLAPGNDFATSPIYLNYVSGAINANPLSIPTNIPSFAEDPTAQWGVQATVKSPSEIYFSLGAYNADPSVQVDATHGIDFSFNPEDGVLSMAQLGYRPHSSQKTDGLPGHYALGIYYDSSDYSRLDDPSRVQSGNYGGYLMLDQMVYQEQGVPGQQGLTPWIMLTLAPEEDKNTMPFAAYGGLLYRGLVPGRDNDISAVAIYYGQFSNDLVDQDYESVFEVNHRFQFGPWFYVTPQFQYIFNPGGTGEVSDAAVFGFEISIDF
ncbi:MAG: carbohydrate porin [Pseudomonadota bacterium]